jgi:hypothetical protein
MNIKLHFIAAVGWGLLFQPGFVRAQGGLIPPGAPAATMKTLAQIEARTPIASAPFTISASGSYYLTTNLTVTSGDAIDILTNGVTLDLNGFTISSTCPTATGTAVNLVPPFISDLTILNGHITGGVTNNSAGTTFDGPGFANGICCNVSYNPFNVRVSGVSVTGCRVNGIYLGAGFNNSVVESCTVNTAGSYGIFAQTVSDSTALNCGNVGVGASATVNNCYGACIGGNGLKYGVYAGAANNCYGYSSGEGIGLYVDTIAIGCFGGSNSGIGVYATVANSCYSTTNGIVNDSGISYPYNMP